MFSQYKCIKKFRSLIIFFQLFALAPISPNVRLQQSLYIFSLISVLIVTIVFLSAFLWNKIIDINYLSTIVWYSFTAGSCIAHLTIVIQAFLCRHQQQQLFQKYGKVDCVLQQKLHYKAQHGDSEIRSIWIKVAIILAILITVNVILVIRMYNIEGLKTFWLHNFMAMMLIRLRCIQTIVYVSLLENRLTIINEVLNGFVGNEEQQVIVWDKAVEKQNKISRVHNKIKFRQLMHLKDVYGLLFEAKELIEDAFGWSLLVIFVQNFVSFTCYGYWTFLLIQLHLDNIDMQIHLSCVLMPIVGFLFLLAHACESCAKTVSSFYQLIFNCFGQ